MVKRSDRKTTNLFARLWIAVPPSLPSLQRFSRASVHSIALNSVHAQKTLLYSLL